MDKKKFKVDFEQKDLKKDFIMMIVFFGVLLHCQCHKNSAIYYYNNSNGPVHVKGYYTLIDMLNDNPQCFKEYKNEICDFIKQEMPHKDFAIVKSSIEEEIQFWFFGLTYEYIRIYNLPCAQFFFSPPFDLKFTDINELLESMKKVANHRFNSKAISSYIKLAKSLEVNCYWHVSHELRYFMFKILKESYQKLFTVEHVDISAESTFICTKI